MSSTVERLAAQVAALQRRVAELETRDRQIAVPATGGTFSGNLTIGSGTGEAVITVDGGAGSLRDLRLSTAGALRWIIRVNSAAESGSNAGSNLEIVRRADDGTNLGSALTITRSTGTVNLSAALQISGTQVLTSRRTGWTAATGTATRSTFATSTVTTAQLAERVKALLDDLITHGIIGS